MYVCIYGVNTNVCENATMKSVVLYTKTFILQRSSTGKSKCMPYYLGKSIYIKNSSTNTGVAKGGKSQVQGLYCY